LKHSINRGRDLGWAEVMRDRLEIAEVEVDHVTMFSEPHASGLASCLASFLRETESESRPKMAFARHR
jgi:hypothetical protein